VDEFLVRAFDVGQPGLFVGGGLVLFKYLLTRHDEMATANLEELKAQVRELRRRVLRAELIVRAYARAGFSLPEREVDIELRLAEELYDIFPEYDNRNTGPDGRPSRD
jgi:hypothetical protein